MHPTRHHPEMVESRPFTATRVQAVWLTGSYLTVPGRFNVLLRVTSSIQIPDLMFGMGPHPLLFEALVRPGGWIECYVPFAQSQADHRFLMRGTAPGDGTVSFTFGRISGLS